jgi:Na+/glutamate symporter
MSETRPSVYNSIATQSGECQSHHTAKSFYGTLNEEGFTPEQVIALATALLGMVAADLVEELPVMATK